MNIIPATSEISHYKVAQALLSEGVTMVHVLHDREGVVVPESCSSRIVHLNFSYRYRIDDFCVDEKGIRASLSFGGVPQFCDIPWSAVCGISSQNTDEFFIWIDAFSPEDLSSFLPPEMLKEFDGLKEMSIFDEYPELRKYALEDSEDDEDEDDEEPPVYAPLRFV